MVAVRDPADGALENKAMDEKPGITYKRAHNRPMRRIDPYALKLLRSMVYGRIPELVPRISDEVSYPTVEDITRSPKRKSEDVVRRLYEEGYLDREFYAKVYRCPLDNSMLIRPRILCPDCNSEDLVRHRLLEHVTCGHVDLERSFARDDGYLCPKDGKVLRQIDVDFRNVGTVYECSSCGCLSPVPVERWICSSSNHAFTLQEASSENVYSYRMREGRRYETKRIFEYVSPFASTFRKHGFAVETFTDIVGASGIPHIVDICAHRRLADATEMTLVNVLIGEVARSEEVLAMYGIVLDTKVRRAVLVAIPGLDEQGKLYATELGLTVIEGEELEMADHKLDLMLARASARGVLSSLGYVGSQDKPIVPSSSE
jgi:predicted RNA-binding Zn-ribbon protein involved in translation (DUF1610 family)